MKQVAIYARVSGDRQVREATIESQRSELLERVKADGDVLTEADHYLDDGVSGTILVRPALERVRDRAAEGRLDRLYIHAPDRLARQFAYQMLLLDEFARAGVEVVFLNRRIGDTPEDALLVQVQGVIAEYERAKIAERMRRGKIYRARRGEVAPLAGAPYGYRYIRKADTGTARYEVVEEEARVVQRIFRELVEQGRSLRAIGRGLTADGIPRRRTRRPWDRGVLFMMLKNPAYMGLAAFGKTRGREPMRRAGKGRRHPSVPKRPKSARQYLPPDQWIRIAVPAIVSEELFERVRHQLQQNRLFAVRNSKPGRHLLKGLTVCAKCRYAYYALRIPSRSKKDGAYVYYRCGGAEVKDLGGRRVCSNRGVRADQLEPVVWSSVEQYLRDPARLIEEFRRRQETPTQESSLLEAQHQGAERAVEKSRRALRRLVEAYEVEVFTLDEVRPRMEAVRQKIQQNQQHLRNLDVALEQRKEWQEVICQVSDFASRVESGLANLDEVERQKLVRLVVDRVEIGPEEITIVHRVPFEKLDAPPPEESSENPTEKKEEARAVG